MAYHWLGLIPRLARMKIQPIRFPGHLFKIALQYRCGLACVSTQAEGTRCKCKCKVSGKRKTIDAYGTHLSVCPWGGWRIVRHDRVNSMYGEFLKEAGNDVCWARVDKLTHALPSHSKDGGRTRVQRIPDVIATDQQGHPSITDAMITLPTAKAKEPLAAAKAGEKYKRDKYSKFMLECAKENPEDPRLHREVIPIVFETYGAAGPTALEHMSLIRHQYGNVVLPCEDKSSESIYHSTWAHQLSTALQLGNAGAIYNIPRGNRAQARPLGDVETDLPPRHKQRDATALIRSNSDTDTDSVPGKESDSGSEGTESDSGGDGGESTESRMR